MGVGLALGSQCHQLPTSKSKNHSNSAYGEDKVQVRVKVRFEEEEQEQPALPGKREAAVFTGEADDIDIEDTHGK